ncbi:AAA family ATPase [Sedimentibacter hydroxybenzoicus DSM 7310]|uniref:endopeptidase La n=1 Tax=Sedimentibacter hydroxybenzoicus DSM 7310 TaxID=1123245 RepID=A0A974BLQ1_SEDHY|nr:ATP-binding protein [Sedimentibacter hydroxybenzoicus]NYB75402.1 AAA family ATPase [Sedimentibacter hydroxybenzoicus DSM 7310]
MSNPNKYKIPTERLKKICKIEEELHFCQTSKDVEILQGVIGQDRAVKSMEFGLSMNVPGYNIFVLGPQGTGKSTYTQSVVSKVSGKGPIPNDWCYINNFSEWDKPLAISLPPGKGKEFQKDMDKLISNLTIYIPKQFEGSTFLQQKDVLIQKTNEKMNVILRDIEKLALDSGFGIQQSGQRVLLIPLKGDRLITPEEYQQLSLDEREAIDNKRSKIAKEIDEKIRDVQISQKIAEEQYMDLEEQTARNAAEPLINQLKEKYADISEIINYLDNVLKDVAENHTIFRNVRSVVNEEFAAEFNEDGENSEEEELFDTKLLESKDSKNPFTRYKVNLFVNNEDAKGAPVVVESNPYYYNLFGKIEYKNHMMTTMTDFTMIKSGALQRANGGYLILQAKDLLMDPYAWDALKKALKYRQALVENIGEQSRFVPTVTLKPEPIPLNVKVILVGSFLYYRFLSADEDFKKLFKVNVDFDVEMDRTSENIQHYVSFIGSMCEQENLKHLNCAAMSKVIEFGSRLADDQDKLSTRFNVVSEILYEASALADSDNLEFVDAEHVERAIKNKKYRSNMIEEKMQQQIARKKVFIDTEGEVVGQVNGLSVMSSSGYSFGLPSRITARTYSGREGIINIERETEMSGNIHSKGVLTLNGYLGGKFAQEKQLGLTAQVTFEQLYGGVEGDSASSAELYAILSSLSDIPIKQSMAVTGSVNQMGEIQPIGGVNEKIEGFFDICSLNGLTGYQGVIIPESNVTNLMLKDEVINAVSEGRFHIYSVKKIEEGLELLTGIPAGEPDKFGEYPKDSIFYFVNQKLREFNKVLEAVEE